MGSGRSSVPPGKKLDDVMTGLIVDGLLPLASDQSKSAVIQHGCNLAGPTGVGLIAYIGP